MKALLVALALFVCVASANVNQHLATVGRVRGADPEWSRFVGFVHKYGRDYHSVRDVNAKFDIFRDNMRMAAEHQRKNPLARFGPTKFSDISYDEFRSTYLMNVNISADYAAYHKSLPKWIPKKPHHHHSGDPDWCGSGACTPIKDQGQCGSCWAFSATEALESAIWVNTKQLPTPLAPQQIVDCDTSDNACGGGIPSSALSYLNSAGGQTDETDYPYTSGQSGAAGQCQCSSGGCKMVDSTTGIKGSTSVSSGSEDDLIAFIKSTGPPSVAVDASSWNSYQGGVLTDCGTNLDHAVQATGLDTSHGTPAITVRNSWGASWGENGFIFLAQGQNTCGIANQAVWPQF